MPDIVITPNRGTSNNPKIDFTGTSAGTIKLEVLADGTIAWNGANGSLFSIADSLSGSLMSVNDISGLPAFEVFSDNRVIVGQFGARLGIGTVNPSSSAKLHIAGLNTAPPNVFLQTTNSSANGGIFWRNSSNATTSAIASNYNVSDASGNIEFLSGGANTRMVVASGGNVGVGTTAPSALFQVASAASGNFRLDSNGSGGHYYQAESNARLGFGRDLVTSAGHISFTMGGGSVAALGSAITMPASGQLGFYTSNGTSLVERMRLDGSGNVGIGTTSPSVKLHVQGSSGEIWLRDSAAKTLVLQTTSNIQYIKAIDVGTGGLPLEFYASQYNFTTGNVGVGITTPSVPLHVKGNGTSNSYRGVIRIENTDTQQWAGLAFPDNAAAASDSPANNYYFIGRGNAISSRIFTVHIPTAANYGSGSEPRFQIYSSGSDLLFSTEANTGMTYLKGNVGIGVSYSYAKLEVEGASASLGDASRIVMLRTTDAFGANVGPGIAFAAKSGASAGYNYFACIQGFKENATDGNLAGGFRIVTNPNGGNPTERLRVTSAGDVGIGTTSNGSNLFTGTFKLDVNGNSRIANSTTGSAYGLIKTTSSTSAAAIILETNGSNDPVLLATGSTFSGTGIKAASTLYLGAYNLNTAIGSEGPSGYIVFASGGTTERMRIAANGNVGIGTTTPSAKLAVSLDVTDSDVGQIRAVGATSAAKMINIGYHTTGNYGFISSLIAGTGYSNLSLQPNGGNVGVGTTGPAVKLEVNDSINTALGIRSVNPNTGTGAHSAFQLGNANGSNGAGVVLFGSGYTSSGLYRQDGMYMYTNRTGGITIAVETNNPLYFATNNTERMRIAGDGNVGIGSTNPLAKLHILSSTPSGVTSVFSNSDIVIDSSTNSYINFRQSADTGAYGGFVWTDNNHGAYIVFRNWQGSAATGGDSLIYGTYQDHIFQAGGAATVNGRSEVMRIMQNGNVGIGVTSPSSKLEVSGNALVSKLFIGSANASYDLYNNGTSYFNNTVNINNDLKFGDKLSFRAIGTNTVYYPNSYWGIMQPKGTVLYYDEEFEYTSNSIQVYNNSGGTAVTITRKNSSFLDGHTQVPNSTGYVLEIKHDAGTSSGASPYNGGWYFATSTGAGKALLCTFKMKVPSGRNVTFHSNNTGTSSNVVWLTNNAGTGQYEDYAIIVNSGTAGWSSTFFFAIDGSTALFYTYLASATVYELTNVNDKNIGGSLGIGVNSQFSNCRLSLSSGNTARFGISDGTVTSNMWTTSSTFYVSTETNHPIQFITNAQNRMIITAGGNVGIGTTSPSSKLEVNGTIKDQYGDLRTIPENAKTAAYVLAASDTGRLITITTGGITVNSGIFSVGQVVTIYNNSASSQTITQGTSVTMYLAGTATTGNRTLAQRGICTVTCVASNTFVASGNGLT